MAHYESYQELEIYKLAREIWNDVWHLITTTSLGNDFKLRDQIMVLRAQSWIISPKALVGEEIKNSSISLVTQEALVVKLNLNFKEH